MVAFEYASGRRQADIMAITKNTRTENIRVVVEDCVVVGGVESICSHALCRPGLGGCVIDVDGGGVRAVCVEDIDRIRELRDSSAMRTRPHDAGLDNAWPTVHINVLLT